MFTEKSVQINDVFYDSALRATFQVIDITGRVAECIGINDRGHTMAGAGMLVDGFGSAYLIGTDDLGNSTDRFTLIHRPRIRPKKITRISLDRYTDAKAVSEICPDGQDIRQGDVVRAIHYAPYEITNSSKLCLVERLHADNENMTVRVIHPVESDAIWTVNKLYFRIENMSYINGVLTAKAPEVRTVKKNITVVHMMIA